jgi:hypothetical protein
VAKPGILLAPRFQTSLKHLSEADLNRVEDALAIVPDCFGRPHAYSGVSIRRLKQIVFECRADLNIRLLFRAKSGKLEFFFAGNHDEVRRIVRDL